MPGLRCTSWHLNLAAYSKSIAHKWGATSPPSDVKAQLGGHKVKSVPHVARAGKPCVMLSQQAMLYAHAGEKASARVVIAMAGVNAVGRGVMRSPILLLTTLSLHIRIMAGHLVLILE